MSQVRVLVALNEECGAEELKWELSTLGYIVLNGVHTGERAIREAGIRCPDIVLMDTQLKGDVDGIDAAGRIELDFDIPVVFISPPAGDATLLQEAGTHGFGLVSKRAGKETLRAAMETALHRHSTERRLREKNRQLARALENLREASVAPNQAGGGVFVKATDSCQTGCPRFEKAVRRIAEVADEGVPLPGMLPAIHEILRELYGIANFRVALFNSSTELVEYPYFADEREAKPAARALGRGFAELVMRAGEAQLLSRSGLHDLARQGAIEQGQSEPLSQLGVPLITGGTATGALVARSYDHRVRFGEEEIRVLTIVAREIVVAVERKHAAEVVRQTGEFFSGVVSAVKDVLYQVDARTGEFAYLSPVFGELLGYTPEDILEAGGREAFLSRVITEEAFREQKTAFERLKARESTGPVRHEAWWRAKDGSLVCLEDRLIPLYDDGRLSSICGVLRDMTAFKTADQKLRESEERFRLISENMADMVSVLDLSGRRLYLSPSHRGVLGDPDALFGSDGFSEIHPEDREGAKRTFAETVRSGAGGRVEYRLMLPDGGLRHLETQYNAVRDEKGKVCQVVASSRDVTETRKLEQQVRRSQRMESIGTLAGGIAHDLNNVLSPILMAISLVRRHEPSRETARILDLMESSAERGSNIVKQILAFGRGLGGKRIGVQPRHIVVEIVKIVRQTFPRSIEVETDLAKDLWMVSADPTELHQVLLNLCVNARDAMPEGGHIALGAENVMVDEAFPGREEASKPGPYVVLSVSDTGTGIPPEIVEKIFEPFFTTKDVDNGTGLGLSTTLAITRSHFGFICLQTELGKGTTFKVYLPALPDEGPPLEAEEKGECLGGRGELILVVDDEESIRGVAKEILEASGYQVVMAVDGAEALRIYQESGQTIRLVITDMVMPVMGGAAMASELRKLNPRVKVIGISGIASTSEAAKLSRPGMETMLAKPFTAEVLLRAVAEVIGAKAGGGFSPELVIDQCHPVQFKDPFNTFRDCRFTIT